MTKAVYAAVIRDDDGILWTEFPDLPGCFGYGKTLIECAESASNALVTHLSAMEQDDRELPEPTDPECGDGVVMWFYADTSTMETTCTSRSDDKLKPCPFCGGKARIFTASDDDNPFARHDGDIQTYWQVAHNCEMPDEGEGYFIRSEYLCYMTPWFKNRQTAIALWNRRAK